MSGYKSIKKVRVKERDLILIASMILITFIGTLVINKTIMLIVLCGIFLAILLKAKFSFFTAFSFILLFSYIQEHIASINHLLAGGMLYANTGIPVYLKELYICTSFFFVLEYAFFSMSSILENEKKLYTTPIILSEFVAFLFGILALMLIILSYPTMPTLSGTLSRNEGLVQSSRFVQISMLLLALTYDSASKYKLLYIIWSISIIWVLFHGERVIVFGFLIYCAFKYLNKQNNIKNKLKSKILQHKKIILTILAGFCIAALGIRLQLSRSGYSTVGLNFKTILNGIFVQGTACDVVYVFNCATDMWKHGNTLNGYTFLQYFVCWIPFLPNPYYPASVIMNYYKTLGGGLFFAEPMMNFGMMGTFVFSFVFLFFLKFVLSKSSQFSCFFWIPFVITIFRMTWYLGLDSWVTMSVYIVPILYFIAKKVR